jgi:hypothetical protein
MDAIEPILLLSAMRVYNKTQIERTLYSKCERVKNWRGIYKPETSLYTDEQCTKLFCKLYGSSPRIMKSGYYNLFETFKRYKPFKQCVYIVCVDNGVRREETNKIKYKYTYPNG